MSWSLINSVGVESTGPVSSQGLTITGVTVGHLVIVSCNSWASAGAITGFTISDTHNTYTSTSAFSGTTGQDVKSTVQQFWSVVTTGGSLTVTVTPNATAYTTFAIAELSFTSGATITAESTSGSNGSSATASSGNLTFTSGDLIYGIADNGNQLTASNSGNFTIDQNINAGGDTESAATCYWLNSSGSPAAAAIAWGSSQQWNMMATAFKATPPAFLLERPFPGMPQALLTM